MPAITSFLELLEPLAPVPSNRELPAPSPRQEEISEQPGQAERDAEARAREILAQAEAEAAELLEDARIQAEALREAAWQEGFHGGQEAGQAAAEIKLEAEARAYREALRAELETIISDIGASRQALWEQQETEMLGFVLDIARQVIKTEVTQNPEVVMQILKSALRRVTDKDNIRIRVAVANVGQVRAEREDLLTLVDGIRHLEIIEDRRVGTGGCVIETNAGTIDAKIETQFAEIERAISPLTIADGEKEVE